MVSSVIERLALLCNVDVLGAEVVGDGDEAPTLQYYHDMHRTRAAVG